MTGTGGTHRVLAVVGRHALLYSRLLIVAAASATAICAQADTGCFDDIAQNYEWDDGGFNWTARPDRCPGSPQPDSPDERKWGGSTQIRASGSDAMVIEENYAWVPKKNPTGCAAFYKHMRRRTRIVKDNILYETVVDDGEVTDQSQKALRDHQMITVGSIQTVPKPNDAYLQVIGNDTIVGQPCQKVVPKAGTPGAGTFQVCIFVAPLDCRPARYLQPLDYITRGPDGQPVLHGRTTLLRVGSRGEVVSADSIRAPK